MVKYISENQISIEEFFTPFPAILSTDNRWVILSKIVPWDKFASVYMSIMKKGKGRPGISPRIVLGALIIKHMMNLDDRGVIEAIQENIYMQYFVGLKEFTKDPVFDPSLFVSIRKRVGADVFDKLNVCLIKSISQKDDDKHNNKKGNKNSTTPSNKGKMQADATVADQYINYPTDNGILNKCRIQCEKMIDRLYFLNNKLDVIPRTYRNVLSKDYLVYAKKKKKSKKAHRQMTRKLLPALKRNIGHINKFLDDFENNKLPFPLSAKELRMLWIVTTVYNQQKYMYDNKVHSCSDRIVSIFQPHVRPIPRGKTAAQVEFGSKLGVSLDQGFARINTFSWNPYNEGGDLIEQVEAYRDLHGHYPELVQVDKIYPTRKNRSWLTERGIRITAPALGRKSEKTEENAYQKRKRKKEAAERNHIEGKFGQGKNGYNLNKIRATLQNTAESWVACIFFVMNLVHFQQGFIFCSIFVVANRVSLIKRLTFQLCAQIVLQKSDTSTRIFRDAA